MPSPFFNKTQEAQIIAAINQAEAGNKGEVKVHIAQKCRTSDPLEQAETLFYQLGMHHTREATGVLLYIATQSRKAAIFADQGVYPRREQSFWQAIIDRLGEDFAKGEPLAGVLNALTAIGDLLREQVPGQDLAGNELPDEIHYD